MHQPGDHAPSQCGDRSLSGRFLLREGVAARRRPLVLAVSASLQAALAAADEEQLAEAATRWAELPADNGEEIHPEFANDMLSEIASLARTATHRRHRPYYWWG